MKIVIADDHEAVRFGLKGVLEAEPGLEVVGEARHGIEAVEKVAELHPDILVTDLKMPGLDGIEVTEEVRVSSPGTRVIILSLYGSRTYVLGALNAGAMGYVLKKSPADGLTDAIRTVAEGKRYVSPCLLKYLN